ncbi:MAG: orotidine-5'-phosphate decarboxylase [bacterium]|nr:orotidine-5'-phosphate decarboxylase [bacterium]
MALSTTSRNAESLSLIDRLFQAVDAKASPIMVGLDPLLDRLPPFLTQGRKGGREGAAEALLEFNLGILEAVADLVPAVKLQMACYELFGPAGLAAFEATCTQARQMGLIVIDDSKRGDIGSTAQLYALGHIGRAPLLQGKSPEALADFVTVNPYLGSDGTDPFYRVALAEDRGVFLLVRTSNPSSGQYQTAVVDGMPLYERIALDLQAQAAQHTGGYGFAPLGAVVGATWPDEAARLRQLMPNVPFLVPGYGAQGGTGDDVMPSFNDQGYGALINSSRGILFAWDRLNMAPEDYGLAARRATLEMREDLLAAMGRASKRPKGW